MMKRGDHGVVAASVRIRQWSPLGNRLAVTSLVALVLYTRRADADYGRRGVEVRRLAWTLPSH